MEQLTRQEAQELGLPRYFTGKPCKRGNVAERDTKTKKCLCQDCEEVRKAACRKWRAENPEKQKAATDDWKKRNPEKQREVWRRAEANKQAREEVDPVYAAKRAEQSRAHSLTHFHRHYGVDEEFTNSRKANAADQKVKRHRAIKKVELTDAEQAAVDAIYAERYELQDATGVELNVDHLLPLKRKGIHHPGNLLVMTQAANLFWGAKIKRCPWPKPVVWNEPAWEPPT